VHGRTAVIGLQSNRLSDFNHFCIAVQLSTLDNVLRRILGSVFKSTILALVCAVVGFAVWACLRSKSLWWR